MKKNEVEDLNKTFLEILKFKWSILKVYVLSKIHPKL